MATFTGTKPNSTYTSSTGYTYKTDARGIPFGAPIKTTTLTPTPTSTSTSTQTSIPTPNTQTGGKTSDFLAAIQAQLLGEAGMVSSTSSQLTDRINAAIRGVNTARDASGRAIESAYDREAEFQSGQAALAGQTFLENRSGFATQMVAFRNLVETTDKSLKDLEQRKQELLLQNDAQAASKVSDLQMKALEFQQQAQQQTFSNLLGMANFGLQAEAEARLARQQSFQESQAVAGIALEYGLDPTGKTLDQITQEAMFFASEDRKMKLAKEMAEVKLLRAQTAKAMQGEPISSYDDNTLKGLAATAYMLQQDPTYNVQGSQAYTQYQNLVGTVTKGGDTKLNKFYNFIGEEAANKVKASVEATMTANKQSQIEKDIANFGRYYDASMKRKELRRMGYSQSEIARSSVGNIFERGIATGQGLENWFTGLFQ